MRIWILVAEDQADGVKHLMQLEVDPWWQPTEQQATKEGWSLGPGHPVGQSVTPVR